MNKKEINEIKRVLRSKDGIIREIYSSYVNAEKEMLSFESIAMYDISEEEESEYIKLFSKVLSTNVEKNFLNLDFPNHKNVTKSQLGKIIKNDYEKDLVEDLFNRIIEYYDNEAAYGIFLAKCVYDIPSRASDNTVLEDSDGIYSFVILAICPIKLSPPKLAYLNEDQSFGNAQTDFLVSPAEVGFLYPSFTGRVSNAEEIGYYIKNVKDPHQEFQDEILGCSLPPSLMEQKDIFAEIVERSFNGQVPLKSIVNINENANLKIQEREEEGQSEPMASFEIEDMLKEAGADQPSLGQDVELMAENIGEKKYSFESEGIKLVVDQNSIAYIRQEDIGGRRSLVIPIYEMTLNGIKL